MVNGPRQCGKTTLVREFTSMNRTYITLDDDTVLESVRNDPTGFVRGLNMAIVDEVQRARNYCAPSRSPLTPTVVRDVSC